MVGGGEFAAKTFGAPPEGGGLVAGFSKVPRQGWTQFRQDHRQINAA